MGQQSRPKSYGGGRRPNGHGGANVRVGHHRAGIPNGIGMRAIFGSIATFMAQVGGMNHTAVAAHDRSSGGV